MSVLVVGLSHRTTPVAVLERAAVSGDELVKLLHDAHKATHVAEAMVVSTCNRVEVYTDVDKFHGGVSAVSELLARHSGIPLEQLIHHLYVHYEDRAVQHLFAVACGLDSMVIGESQVLGQLREAFKVSQDQGTVGRVLNELVRHALRVGKRAHTETQIDRVGASLVEVGLAVAARQLGSLAGRRALVVGAGSTSGLATAILSRHGVTDIVVANRTYAKAQQLAASVGGRAAQLDELAGELASADLVVSCTGAIDVLISTSMAERALAARERRPMVFCDLALPHDIAEGVGLLGGATLIDLDSLRSAAEAAIPDTEIEAVRKIVGTEVASYLRAGQAARVAPTVVALRSKAAEVVEAELSRLTCRLPQLDDRARTEIAQAVRRVVDKLLHGPTVRVKELAGSQGGDHYAEALRELFDLDPKAPEAVTRADVEVEP